MAGRSVEQAKSALLRADCVTLDVDSTVCTDEGIDELAAYLGVGDQVAKLTSSAMAGEVTFKTSLQRRLGVMPINRQVVEQFVKDHPPSLTPGVSDVVSTLQDLGVHVYLISGGFQSLIEPVAQLLNIPNDRILANNFIFNSDGSYSGFDETRPVCDSGGKLLAVRQLREKNNYKCVVHVGDGATDLEAAEVTEAFIGFGGNQIREKVKSNCDWFVTSFKELLNVLGTKTKI